MTPANKLKKGKKEHMNKEFFQKNRGLLIAGVIIIILIIISATRSSDNNTNSPVEQGQEQMQEQDGTSMLNEGETKNDNTSTSNSSTNGQLVREGTLLVSDDSKQGNYMVRTSNSIFYIRTSRDFSSLVNKEVTMTAKGTVEMFSLVDIVAR